MIAAAPSHDRESRDDNIDPRVHVVRRGSYGDRSREEDLNHGEPEHGAGEDSEVDGVGDDAAGEVLEDSDEADGRAEEPGHDQNLLLGLGSLLVPECGPGVAGEVALVVKRQVSLEVLCSKLLPRCAYLRRTSRGRGRRECQPSC